MPWNSRNLYGKIFIWSICVNRLWCYYGNQFLTDTFFFLKKNSFLKLIKVSFLTLTFLFLYWVWLLCAWFRCLTEALGKSRNPIARWRIQDSRHLAIRMLLPRQMTSSLNFADVKRNIFRRTIYLLSLIVMAFIVVKSEKTKKSLDLS